MHAGGNKQTDSRKKPRTRPGLIKSLLRGSPYRRLVSDGIITFPPIFLVNKYTILSNFNNRKIPNTKTFHHYFLFIELRSRPPMSAPLKKTGDFLIDKVSS